MTQCPEIHCRFRNQTTILLLPTEILGLIHTRTQQTIRSHNVATIPHSTDSDLQIIVT